MIHSLDVTGLTEDEQGEDKYATYALQYGVLEKTLSVKVYGDQEWVAAGAAAKELEGITVVREVFISYGPWKPVS